MASSNTVQIVIDAVDKTKAALASVQGNLEGLSSIAGNVSKALGALGAALSVGALVAAGKAALDTADELSKLSVKTGISVESLSLLKPIAEQSGVSMEGLAKGVAKLSTSMNEAAGGSKEQTDTFRRLGVSVQTTTGQLRPTEEVLLDLADAFSAMPNGAEKSALAMKLFGKSGVEMIPFLNQGKAGIEQLKEKFKDLGLEISGDTARAAENFNDTLDTVKQALSAVAMKVAEAALPALQQLADALVSVASHGEAIMTVLRLLGEALVATLAVRGVAAVASLTTSFAVLRAAISRFLPILIALGVWEMGRGIYNMIQTIRDANREVDELTRQKEQLDQLNAAMQELADTGTLSVKSQMILAAAAAVRLREALPGTAIALGSIRDAAVQAGTAISESLDAETKKAAETVKQLATSYKQVAADIKTTWDARVTEIEANYKRQSAAAQTAAKSESASIRESAQSLLDAEREKLTAVQAGATQMEAAWRTTYSQAVALARAAGQDVTTIERQAVDARISLYTQIESAYRSTIDRLIAEEQRHLNAARQADEARLNLRLSIEDRIRELGRKAMDESAAYTDRQRQIDEKQAQAKDALAQGNYEQARKLAEESIALAERSASAVTRQVEQNGKTVTETVVSDASAAATAIGQIKESASIADTALAGLGDAHKKAASAAESGAQDAKQALASVTTELDGLRQKLLSQDKIKLEIDIDAARSGIEKIKALTDAQQLTTKLLLDTADAKASLEALKADADNITLIAKVEADTTTVLSGIEQIKQTLSAANVEIPAIASFEQPRAQLASFAQDARAMLAKPTEATHTVKPNLSQYQAAVAVLQRPTFSTHTITVRTVKANAQGGLIQKLAEGGQAASDGFKRMTGRIFGPGTATSDSVPALLSAGEYVVRAASVRKFGEGFFAALNAGFLPAVPRFAAGGAVGSAQSAILSDTSATTPARDVVDLRFNIGGKQHTVQSSRDTATQLAQALRELSRGA